MVLGEKLWEGKGKSDGPGFIKYVGMEGVDSMYSWSAQLKGLGRAKGVDISIHATGKSWMTPKGVGKAKDQAVFMTATGDMGVLKGFALSKRVQNKSTAVGVWHFMTNSEKLGWINDLIAVVSYEPVDPMWMELNLTIYEWK
ncbi:MAG TPA: hypothetical protein VK487_12130 [Candidatus Bathyarchaeia archaeon]|nr:hypothetical protein [Candidatus Bathyarchaeia archaeon]